MGLLPFLFPALVVLILFWMLCCYLDDREAFDVPPVPEISESLGSENAGEQPILHKKDATWIKGSSYSSLGRQAGIREQKSCALETEPSQNEQPHDHHEYPPEPPEALRPRRIVLARPPEEEEEEPPVKKSVVVQTDEDVDLVPKSSAGTQKNVATEEETAQTELPPLLVSQGVQAVPKTEDAEIQTEEVLILERRPTGLISEEVSEDSLESYSLKPKYLSSPSQSEESEQESSRSSGELRQKYSIIQPFMPKKEENLDE